MALQRRMSGVRGIGPPGIVLALLVAMGCRTVESPTTEAAQAGMARPAPAAITALGRLEPKDGIIRVSGPSRPTVVIAKLLVAEGDWVAAGQPIAILDTLSENEPRVARARAELTNAQTELGRVRELFQQGIASVTLRDATQLKVDVARAELQAADAALALDTVRAPLRAQVITLHARSGERVGAQGIAELAQTDRMYAVAEVYETDIGRVKPGQRATVSSPALGAELSGSVEGIGRKVGKLDLLDTDPAARTDARVVEVDIRLDDGAQVVALSNLQVEVAIHPD